jgi:signal transduction histidine kinase
MSVKGQIWSLAARMHGRLVWVTCAVTLVTASIVAVHYGGDVSDLRQRKVLERAEGISGDISMLSIGDLAALDESTIREQLFVDHPEAYGWRIINGQSGVLATSSFDWNSVSGVPKSEADEWTHALEAGGWVAGKRFDCEGQSCVVEVIAVSDPANRLLWLIFGEVVVHIILPILPFAFLMLLASRRIIDSTLRPLIQIQNRARSIRELRDVEPIEPGDAPIEIHELTTTLNATLYRLKDAMEREREFLLDAAHTLRTPLAALKANLEVNQGNVDLPALRADIDALIRLCEQMLTSALADRLRVSPMQRVDAEQLIANVVTRLDSLARQAGVELAFERHSSTTLVQAEADGLAIALANLVENAIQHAPRGSEVVIALNQDPLRISVRDFGPGLPGEHLDAFKTPFVRGTGQKAGGAGLGLSIADRIMTAHGGRLELSPASPSGLIANLVF